MVKNLPAMQGTQVQSLSQEDPLEKRKATHSSILAWRSQWTEEPGELQSMGSQRLGHGWVTSTFTFTFRYADNTSLVAKSEEEVKSLLMRVKEESEKAGLKLNIYKTKTIASDPITSGQRKGKSGSSDRFSFLGLQNHCGW